MIIAILFIYGTLLSLTTIPVLVKIVDKFDIYNPPTSRDLHKGKIPKLMGLVFYFGIILASVYLFKFQKDDQMLYLITALSIILYIGVRDDIYNMSPWGKIMLQGVAIMIILIPKDLFINDLHGFLGMNELNDFVAYPLTLFIGIFMINSFNLIDGVDGLAGMMSIFMLTCFGLLFYLLNDLFLVYLIAILIGTTAGYLRFNLSENRKVFMGDTGSLILGFFMFFFLLQLINHNYLNDIDFLVQKDLSIWFGLLIFLHPILDSGSIFISRLKKGKSPFSPDNGHIHHLLLNRFESHRMVSLIVLGYSLSGVVINVGVVYFFAHSYIYVIPAYIFISFIFIYVLRKRNRGVN